MLHDLRRTSTTSSAKMSSQRFCLRWNNHQSNLLSVFDQLLHAETFTDVTLAVEGQFLKAHKMVLSACSPYFQALFLNHPEKHPIVILKDVPYSDMKSLLDFMYRGEVSVDQERLTAFLRVAESLRIKGLTEVNEEKCDLPAITNSLLQQQSVTPTLTPPPQLHRIHPYLGAHKNRQSHLMMNPLLGNALTQPKRKRGRPRKLSGCSNGTPGMLSSPSESYRDDYENRLGGAGLGDSLIQGSPEMLEVKMGMDGFQNSGSGGEGSEDNATREDDDIETMEGDGEEQEPTASTSKENSPRKSSNKEEYTDKTPLGLLTPKSEPSSVDFKQEMLRSLKSEGKIRVNPITQTATTSNANALYQITSNMHAFQSDSLNNNTPEGSTGQQGGTDAARTAPTPTRQPVRRRVRRRANSASNDPAEHLTEMSVRGLNLFRYASVNEGVYQCTECAKENIQKTFKNKYSFQRHAFLYHEGKQRKVFPCPVCAKEFSRPDKMKNHMKTTHDCYMPKDCVFPMGFYMPPGIEDLQQQIPLDGLQVQQQPTTQVDCKPFQT